MKITCENLGKKNKQLYLSVVGLIKKESMRGFLSLCLSLLLTNIGKMCSLKRRWKFTVIMSYSISSSKICVFL